MSRRHVKEYRPDEALTLISADRDGQTLCCPSCGSNAVGRTPARPTGRANAPPTGRVELACGGCGRLVSYIDRDTAGPHRVT
jgi:hypothetical protein